MIEFDKDHSSAWLEMMSAYQFFRSKLFDWTHEPDQVKQKDLLLELGSWEGRDLHRRMLVVNLLRSTEMWDEKASRNDLPLLMRCCIWQQLRKKKQNPIPSYSITAACCCMI